jgi:hypothetical protein
MANEQVHRHTFDATSTGDLFPSQADTRIPTRMLARFNQFCCGLHGHDKLMQFEKTRMFLRCVSCGHESPGWALTETPPRVVYRADAHCQAHALPRLMSTRRVA